MKTAVSVRRLRRVRAWASLLVHAFASLKLAVALWVVLASVLSWATVLEATRGREMAHWFVYGSPGFLGLLALLGLNILAAMLVRWPWRKHQLGFLFTHLGLLVILAGASETLQHGIEGQIVLREGDRTDHVLVRGRSLITVDRPSAAGRQSSQFLFQPGAVDWREDKALEFRESQDLGLKVLKFYRYARPHVDWVADVHEDQGAALRLVLSDRVGQTIAEDWLTASTYGGEVLLGPTKYTLLPLPLESMLQDFLQPPTEDLGTAGILSMHFHGEMHRVRIDVQKGQTVPLGESGASVEIVDYYPDAKPMPDGRTFIARSDRPRNPVLELRVHLPGEPAPLRQLAFAKAPLLNLDGVFGRVCPVRFWYHHPSMPQTPGAVFVQTPAGKLYGCPVVAGSLSAPAEIVLNGKIPVGAQYDISVKTHLPRARRDVTFTPLEPDARPASTDEAAVLVALSIAGTHRQVWLSRAEDEFGLQTVGIPGGLVAVRFGYQQLPLGFTLELNKVHHVVNPQGAEDAAFESSIKLLDTVQGKTLSRVVSLNEPLVHGKFTFYQSGFQELPSNLQASVLTVAHDPGRFCKYCGSIMICGGLCILFSMRSKMFLNLAAPGEPRASAPAKEESLSQRASIEPAVPPPLGLFRPQTRSSSTLR
ncbi:MAG: cytochrome c biogenesis protein ResB [Pirellulaceae bacterium]